MSKSKQSLFEDLDHLAVKYTGGAQPNHDTSESNSRHQRLARLAIVIGGCTIVAACVVGFLSFQVSREMSLRRMAQQNLAIARTVASYVDEHPPVGDAEAINHALERIRAFWTRFDAPTSEAFLCVVNRAGEMVVCTSDKNMEGESVFDLSLEAPNKAHATTIGDLLGNKQDFWGEDVTLMGEQQLVGFAYSENLDHGVMVHFPSAAINREVVAAALPWSMGIVIIIFVFTPLSLGLLYRSYSSAQRSTERAEKTLRLQGQIVDSMTEGISLVRPTDGLIIYCNPPFERMFGYERGELVGQHISVVNAPGSKSPEETANEIIASLQETGSCSGEVYNVKKDGTLFWSRVNITTLQHPDYGEVWVTVKENITERKKAEEALRVESERNQRVFAGAMDGFVTLDLNGSFCEVNQAYCAIIGYSRDELLGMSMQDVEVQETTEETAQHIELLLKTGSDRFVSKQRRSDGRLIDVEVSANLIDVGDEARICSFIRDVTERKQIEEDLQQTQFAVEHCSNPIYWVSKDGKISYANEAACQSLGYCLDELVSMLIPQIDPDFPEDAWPAHWMEMKQAKRLTFEAKHQHKDGHLFPVQITSSFLEYKSQEFIWAYVTDISERKRAEEQAARFSRVLEHSLNEIYIFDAETLLFLEVNREALENLGYSLEEIRGLTPLDLKPEFTAESFAELIEPLQGRSKETIQFTTIHRRKDGTQYPIEVYLQLTDDEVPVFVAIILDITERKRAEDALRQSEERLDLAVRGTSDGLWDADLATGKEYWSPRFKELLGYEEGEIKATHDQFLAFLHPEDKAAAQEAIRLHLQENQPYDYEFRMQTKSGEYRWFQSRGEALRDNKGKPYRMAGSIRDITERRHTEEALRESEIRFRTMFESAAIGMALNDVNGRFIETNPAFQRLFGYSAKELDGMKFTEITHSEDRDKGWKLFKQLVSGKMSNIQLEKRYICKDGSVILANTTASVIYDSHGRFLYSLGMVQDITARKRAEEAVAISESRFRGLLEAEPDGVVVVDSKGIIQLANAVTEEMFGYAHGELIGKPVEVFVPENLRASHILDRAAYLTSPHSRAMGTDLQVEGQRKDGSVFPADVSLSPLKTDEGLFVMSIIRDITERKQVEAALRDSEERFRVVFEAAPSGMAIADADGKSLRYNNAMQKMLGYNEEELRSMDVAQYTHADDVAEGRQLFDELRHGKRDHYQVEKRYIRKDGKILWAILAFSSVHNDQGEVQYLIASVKDITERKLAEADRLRLAGAVESAGEAIMITNAEGIIQYVNPAFTQINGYSLNEAVGKNPRFLKSGKHSAEFYREMWDTLLRGEPWRGQFINRKKGGELYDVDATIAPVHDSNGQLVNYVAVVRDITERKRAEEQARQLQVDLAHMSRVSTMGEMASGLAHELNQPLTVIANYANGSIRRLRSDKLSQDEIKEMFERISAQARRGGSIIRGLESLVRKGGFERAPIDINESILEVVDLAGVDAARYKATTHLELKPNLPSVLADPTQVQQVILNLVQNACEACEHVPVSQRSVTIHTAWAGDDELEITVSDSGPGIDSELSDHLFEPFFTTKQKGMGMGLAISRSIIEAHNGKLWLTTNPRSGASFHFTLPIAKEDRSHGK